MFLWHGICYYVGMDKLESQIKQFQGYIELSGGDDVQLGMGIKAADILERLLELSHLQTMLDEFEEALRDIYTRVKETGVE